MQTGPKADSGFDLALTELIDGDSHEFLVEVGSARGADVLEQVPHRAASDADMAAAAAVVDADEKSDGPSAWKRTAQGAAAGAISTTRAGTMSPSAA